VCGAVTPTRSAHHGNVEAPAHGPTKLEARLALVLVLAFTRGGPTPDPSRSAGGELYWNQTVMPNAARRSPPTLRPTSVD
jgi:hypothetical protein